MKNTDFASLSLRPELLDNLGSLSYHQMTPVQAESLPHVLDGCDLLARAKTGSGKTAAFALGVLQSLETERFVVQALILCPTRELADQVAKETRRLARGLPNVKVLTLCGGAPFGPQLGSLAHGAHIVVGTPGRVEEHLHKGSLKLNQLSTFVLDEADRMLDMGFQPSLDAILDFLPARRQNLLFSATFPEQIQATAKRVLQDPVRVEVDEMHTESSIEQWFSPIEPLSRMEAIRLLLLTHRPDSTLVFCNTKQDTRDLAEHLNRNGLSVRALHGDMEQKERDQTLVTFANKSVSVLVATDVAARGLDIEAVDLVLNFQIARERAVHVHRVGRTGRAGSSGKAITLLESKERFKLERLEEMLGQPLLERALPDTNQLKQPAFKAPMATLEIDGGKKQKLRPGDILGALTAADGLQGSDVGKIHLYDQRAFVAVKREHARTALDLINQGKLKGKSFRARFI